MKYRLAARDNIVRGDTDRYDHAPVVGGRVAEGAPTIS